MTEFDPTPPVSGSWRDLVHQGRYGGALRAYRMADGTDPVLLVNLEALADIQAALREKAWRRAQRVLEGVEARHEALPWADIDRDLTALREAGAALDAREPDAARTHLAHAEGAAFAAEAAAILGTLAIYEGDNEAARGHFDRALALDPDHFRALTNLGNLLLESGDVDGAIAAYERAIRLNDGFANAHHNLGVAYRKKGMISQSVKSLRKAQRESGRRDAEDARVRLSRRGGAGTPSGSSRTLRYVLIALALAAAYWFFVGRSP